MTDSLIREALARSMHAANARQTNIYHEPHHIDTAWAADGKNRGQWTDNAQLVIEELARRGYEIKPHKQDKPCNLCLDTGEAWEVVRVAGKYAGHDKIPCPNGCRPKGD